MGKAGDTNKSCFTKQNRQTGSSVIKRIKTAQKKNYNEENYN